jgi:hypothetical protein
MVKKANTKRPSAVSQQELVQLNAASSELALATERFHHAITKGHLLRALHDNARLQLEVNQSKAGDAARLASEQHLLAEKEALEHKTAKQKHLHELAQGLRSRYSVEDKFAIDPMSGEFLNPEA